MHDVVGKALRMRLLLYMDGDYETAVPQSNQFTDKKSELLQHCRFGDGYGAMHVLNACDTTMTCHDNAHFDQWQIQHP